MTSPSNHFSLLLVPDASAGRRTRTIIAERKLGLGVKVVTWIELIEEARLAYLLSPLVDNWNDSVKLAIEETEEGYWRRSFNVDPSGTATAVAVALDEAIRYGTSENWSAPLLSKRTNSTLSDLWRLWEHMDFMLPPELMLIDEVRSGSERAISKFSVHKIDGWPRLDRFQSELLDLLSERGAEPNQNLLGILQEIYSLPTPSATTSAPQKLAHLCFTGSKGEIPVSDDIGFLVARDPLQEVECATGIIQSLTDKGVLPEEIGVLLPDAPYYAQAFADALTVIGQPIAGLTIKIPLRDLPLIKIGEHSRR
ncbi:hypothetical protein [Magnetovibrio blakemorei]|uniref:Uncharacterized protein n=1 Tax=Magnetovibrio blakemorei TaxID=28181 RepID=A0A1E5Q8D2_9PROT|nr:hypothetical protein [Magnetovibrio blakemorei]OEJ67624.1 hypothetical protein BEN30_09395 [Magnetovibrio blakemorei]